MVPLRFGQSLAAADLEDLVRTWNTQSRTRAQYVDIAAKRFGIGLEDCQHGLVHRQTAVRSNL